MKANTGKYTFLRSYAFGMAIPLLVFAIIYSLISLVNHYFFRTYTLDLGFYTNALYDYRQLRFNDSSSIFENGSNMLGGHFEPVLFLFAPLSYLFGSYTLLIIQILFLLFGGYGIHRYFSQSDKGTPIAATVYFLGYFTLFAALAFDFHTNVIAAAVLPFLFLAVKNNRPFLFSLVFIFMLLCKENISIWLVFISLGLAFEHRKIALWRNRFLMAAVIAGVYFVTVVFWVIPAFSPTGSYTGFLYSVVGDSPMQALQYMLLHPLETLKLLFVNHSGLLLADGYKTEFHLFVFFTGLPLLLFRPVYLFMLIPLYFQKMLHNDPSMWGVGFHYGAEFAPILSIGLFEVVSVCKKNKLKTIVLFVLPLLSMAVTFRSMDKTEMFTDKSRIRFYQKGHYSRKYGVKPIKELLNKIPSDAVICAQSPFFPHLALRDKIYQFPLIKDAEYIVFSKSEVTYPLSLEEFDYLATKLLEEETESFELWQNHESFYILKKRL